jgi:hypothetical protein
VHALELGIHAGQANRDAILSLLREKKTELFSQYSFLLGAAEQSSEQRGLSGSQLEHFSHLLEELPNRDVVNRLLDEAVATVSADSLFEPYVLQLGDMARQNGKKLAKVSITAEKAFRIRPQNYIDFSSSLVHIFRNIVDHGIE